MLANRLSADPANRVLLLEAGGKDNNLMVRIPRGFGKLLGNERFTWFFPTEPMGKSSRVEVWGQGQDARWLERGQRDGLQPRSPADWDGLAARRQRCVGVGQNRPPLQGDGRRPVGTSPTRGTGGPLGISSGTVEASSPTT